MTENSDGKGLSTGQQAFLQGIIARRIITSKEARQLIARIRSVTEKHRVELSDVSIDQLNQWTDDINAGIVGFDLEIRRSLVQSHYHNNDDDHNGEGEGYDDEINDNQVYGIVNMVSDGLSQMATEFSPEEIAYIKRVIDAMFETNNLPSREVMAVRKSDALRLGKVPRNLDATRNRSGLGNFVTRTRDFGDPMEESTLAGDTSVAKNDRTTTATSLTSEKTIKVLEALMGQGWMVISPAEYISLGPRALMELRTWLQETYNEPLGQDEGTDGETSTRWQRIKMCEACREIVTVGQRCSDHTCLCRLHTVCVKRFFGKSRPRLCPKCGIPWMSDHFVGEAAIQSHANAIRNNIE